MREILYRAISLCLGEHWLYGQPRHYAHNPHTEKWTIYDPKTGIETDIVPETLGEYSEISDKESKPIFEGDIIKVESLLPETFGKECICIVIYEDGCLCLQRIDKPHIKQPLRMVELVHNIEIIGNIHDNPELQNGAINDTSPYLSTPSTLSHQKTTQQ